MKKILLLFLVTFIFAFIVIPHAYAAKAKVVDITASASVSKNKREVIAYFGNLQNARSVSFTLIYETNGQQEGAGGSVKITKGLKNVSRSILLGTCSKKVCRYHTKIKNMQLIISGKLTNGKSFSKTLKIKY